MQAIQKRFLELREQLNKENKEADNEWFHDMIEYFESTKPEDLITDITNRLSSDSSTSLDEDLHVIRAYAILKDGITKVYSGYLLEDFTFLNIDKSQLKTDYSQFLNRAKEFKDKLDCVGPLNEFGDKNLISQLILNIESLLTQKIMQSPSLEAGVKLIIDYLNANLTNSKKIEHSLSTLLSKFKAKVDDISQQQLSSLGKSLAILKINDGIIISNILSRPKSYLLPFVYKKPNIKADKSESQFYNTLEFENLTSSELSSLESEFKEIKSLNSSHPNLFLPIPTINSITVQNKSIFRASTGFFLKTLKDDLLTRKALDDYFTKQEFDELCRYFDLVLQELANFCSSPSLNLEHFVIDGEGRVMLYRLNSSEEGFDKDAFYKRIRQLDIPS